MLKAETEACSLVAKAGMPSVGPPYGQMTLNEDSLDMITWTEKTQKREPLPPSGDRPGAHLAPPWGTLTVYTALWTRCPAAGDFKRPTKEPLFSSNMVSHGTQDNKAENQSGSLKPLGDPEAVPLSRGISAKY